MIVFEVNFGTLKGGQRVPRRRIAAVFGATSRILKLSGRRSVSVAFVNTPAMRQLNEAYHGERGVTDVLAFPSDALSGRDGYLGEIVLHYSRAKQQAQARGVSVRRELDLLLVHGLLHLLGYDHDTDTKRARMFRLQDRILNL
ncbi:rRNA maturation RNase YbeY [Candidatus Uhrbacteria bacterium RIFCSPHIGHO2_02_FULL_53_13]|uniref:Endoribonuclease YbeY n=2 Tax=Candidatus Uhriibacteriota TaxID=1752732 RepID=A0A1F7TX04_9BACT|nr:MAG: rRNA maturation RNase YbeY [Candidatus Uhrbacteria bacterium RIFCSPHIGHO2_02_FULL_53_13]OGL90019.1 MAG: rRNA maturation RNase YbeY [Candidatus Uhrbacteria bacterium RIFCSPLOWO2_02_FULL_53_10]